MVNNISGTVFDIDHFAVHDGPGIRTCVYLKGCPLRCEWCHSPESQGAAPQLLYAAGRCVNCGACARTCPLGLHAEDGAGAHLFADRRGCTHCGACAGACPSGALRVCGRVMGAGEVAREALEDLPFFKNSGGGVTLTGGEALFQPRFALEILKLVKAAGAHTIVETSGYGKPGDLLALVPYTDCFYYDFKLCDETLFARYIRGGAEPARVGETPRGGGAAVVDSAVGAQESERVSAAAAHTGAAGAVDAHVSAAGVVDAHVGASLIRDNLEKLRKFTDSILLRVPLIPGLTDTNENLFAAIDLAVELRIPAVQLLPYNASAGAKYEWIGRAYKFASAAPNAPDVAALKARSSQMVNVWI